jgi:hemoglobin-like flavoprotein
MLTDKEKKLVVNSWRLVVPIAETAADLFYRRLFEIAPQYQKLFPNDMVAQKRKLVVMLQFIVKSVDWVQEEWAREVAPEDDLALVVLAMGRRHTSLYKIPDESYSKVGEALLWTLDQGLGQAFTDEVRSAWTHLYGTIATTMKLGGRAGRIDMGLGKVS